MDYNPHDISQIELATEESITNVIEHAFEEDEDADFQVIYDEKPLGLNIIIKEKGIPFDPALIPEFNASAVSNEYEAKGLGTYLVRNLIDEVKFLNLGKEGKETHLFKYINNHNIEQLMDNDERALAEKEKKEEVLPKGSVKYSIRRMKPEEAVEVSKGAYSSYGYSYVLEHIYFPERVREMNLSDELISFVAVAGNEVIAHAALEMEEADKSVPQLGVAFTKPKFRGQGCLNELASAIMEDAFRRNLTGVYARGITTHPYSQKSCHKFSMKDCCILLSSGPEREYKGIVGKPQRESVVLIFRYLHPPESLKLFAPAQHESIIEKIYNHLGVEVNFIQKSDFENELPLEATIIINTEPHNQVGKIRVQKYGKNVINKVESILKDLCMDRMETIYLFLNLHSPGTQKFVNDFEKLGFFFAGILPGSEGNDQLILQYLNNYKIDFDKLQIAGDMAKEILGYIKGCQK